MGFFNNIGGAPPTKDNIYSLFIIPEVYYRYYGKVRITKTSTGICISIDSEIYSNKGAEGYVSESKDYDTEKIVKYIAEKQLCIEDMQEIILFFTTKSREYMPDNPRLVFQPEGVIAEIVLKNGDHLSRIYIDPIEM